MDKKVENNDLMKTKRRRARERRAAKPITVEPHNGRFQSHDVAGEWPSPRLGVFSGDDPTLAERFEEELYKRKDD